jgi:tRNA 2-(methylsulfanyl)-N6-isopentenyladenosine37 hydroxylase
LSVTQDLTEIHEFLGAETPDRWVENALEQQDVMLIDHAHCEKKAAMTAVNMIHSYPDNAELLTKMSRLAREELRHFEQVLKFIKQRKLRFVRMTASRYAAAMRESVRKHEPEKVVDLLIIGAFIEARSCERFAKLAPHLDNQLKDFYLSLLKSEARHYQDYLKLARNYAGQDLDERVEFFRAKEVALIVEPDKVFRFHSGPIV